MKWKKKALSDVVATVMLVLLTLVAIGIVAGVIIPLVREKTDSTQCVSYIDYFTFEEDLGYNCYNSTDPNNILYGVSVRAAGAKPELVSEVVGLKLSFLSSGGTTTVIDLNDGAAGGGNPRMVDDQQSIEIPGSGEVRTYVYNGGDKFFKKVEVFPVLKSGRICDASDSIKIEGIQCADTTVLTI